MQAGLCCCMAQYAHACLHGHTPGLAGGGPTDTLKHAAAVLLL